MRMQSQQSLLLVVVIERVILVVGEAWRLSAGAPVHIALRQLGRTCCLADALGKCARRRLRFARTTRTEHAPFPAFQLVPLLIARAAEEGGRQPRAS